MTVINLPIDYSSVDLASEDESVFWKQIIPLDKEISYGGQKLKFGRSLLERLKANYDAKVTNQTAFQLADDQNRHDTAADVATGRNFDPERYRGEIQELKLTNQGLVGKFKLTSDGVKLIKNNPKLGVSASIKPDYVGEDGTKHDFVLRHVVGTLDSKIKHMSPWQREEITLSATDDPNEEVYDLTTTEPATDPNKISVDKAEYEAMRQQVAEIGNGSKLLDEILAETDVDEVKLSAEEPKIDPALVALQNRVAASDWRAQRAELINAGVPNAMLNLCDGVMSVHESPTINLSDGTEADPRETIMKLLHEAKGTVDFSAESGHGLTVDERDAEDKSRKDWVDGFMNQYTNDLF